MWYFAALPKVRCFQYTGRLNLADSKSEYFLPSYGVSSAVCIQCTYLSFENMRFYFLIVRSSSLFLKEL